jgi:hypothetical protein
VNEQAEPCLPHPPQAFGTAAALTIAAFKVAGLMVVVLTALGHNQPPSHPIYRVKHRMT